MLKTLSVDIFITSCLKCLTHGFNSSGFTYVGHSQAHIRPIVMELKQKRELCALARYESIR